MEPAYSQDDDYCGGQVFYGDAQEEDNGLDVQSQDDLDAVSCLMQCDLKLYSRLTTSK